MLADVAVAVIVGTFIAVIATYAARISADAWLAGAGKVVFHLASVAASVAIAIIAVITLLGGYNQAITAQSKTSAGLAEADKARFHCAGAAASVAA